MDDTQDSLDYQYTSYNYDSRTPSRSRSRRATSSHRPSTARPRTGVSTIGVDYEKIICAITESRGLSPTVGLAFINIDRAQGILCQIADGQTYARTIQKLEVYSPAQILIANTAVNPPSNLVTVLDEHAEHMRTELVVIDRRFWLEKTGMEYLENLAFSEDIDSMKTAIGDNYYAICSFSAVIKHLEYGLNMTVAPHSLPIRYETTEGSMMIDSATIRSLELIQNLNSPKSKHCLYGLLNKTSTSMGARLLRNTILQPLTDTELLGQRYAALDELVSNEDLFFGLQSALKKFPDTDKALTYLVMVPRHLSLKVTEQNVNNIIIMKDFISKIDNVLTALSHVQSELLRSIRQLCGHHRVKRARELLSEAINEDTIYAAKPVDLRNQRVYAVKSGYNGLLDVARVTYKESTEDAMAHVTQLATEHDLSLELCFDQPRQHYIRLPVSELEDKSLPEVFINVIRRKKWIECQTLQLRKHNVKIADSHHEVLLMSDSVTRELMAHLCEHAPIMFKISEGVAMLDVLVAYASLVMTGTFVRPAIGQALALRGARHPIREQMQENKFVPNDVFATETRRFQVVTGCNMSGKSIYIRSLALTCIMAQIGCYVPAEQAVVPIIKQLLARVSTDDVIEANVSTFSAEMREAAYILDNVDKDSLVIIDELGRGTSTQDGLAISLAIAEALVSSRALCWYVTHFKDLARILSERAGVTSMHLSVDTSRAGVLAMSYQVTEGVERAEHYGLLLAKALPFPTEVLVKAEQVARELSKRAQEQRKASLAILHARRRKLTLQLTEQLQQAHQGAMSDTVLREWLKSLLRDFVVRMGEIDASHVRTEGDGHSAGDEEETYGAIEEEGDRQIVGRMSSSSTSMLL